MSTLPVHTDCGQAAHRISAKPSCVGFLLTQIHPKMQACKEPQLQLKMDEHHKVKLHRAAMTGNISDQEKVHHFHPARSRHGVYSHKVNMVIKKPLYFNEITGCKCLSFCVTGAEKEALYKASHLS